MRFQIGWSNFLFLLILCVLFFSSCSALNPPPLPTITPRPPTPTSTNRPETSIEQSHIDQIPMIYDDDGSPDGTTAMFYLLAHPAVDLKVVSLTFGEVNPEIYIQHLGRQLDAFGFNTIALGYGERPPHNALIDFPQFLRDVSDDYWGLPIPYSDRTYPAQPAPQLIVDTINNSPEPITVVVHGPLTNLAAALQLDPGIKDNIAAVYIMGGAVYVPGNVHDFYPEDENVYAEWNIVADPPTAKEVFEFGLDEVYLIPLDATDLVWINRSDPQQWQQGGQIGDLAGQLYTMLMDGWNNAQEALIWDLAAAVIMMEPESCEYVHLPLTVVTEVGPTLGQTATVEGGEPNIYVCLEPDAELIRQSIIKVFSNHP